MKPVRVEKLAVWSGVSVRTAIFWGAGASPQPGAVAMAVGVLVVLPVLARRVLMFKSSRVLIRKRKRAACSSGSPDSMGPMAGRTCVECRAWVAVHSRSMKSPLL